jgi:hypothetical protein
MTFKTILAGAAAALVLGALTTGLLAQNGPGPGPNGRGYGGPPKTEEERLARQYSCPQQSGQNVCPQGGQCGQGFCGGRGFCGGQGQGNGRGYGYGCGLRDGTGPRSMNGTCPAAGAGATEQPVTPPAPQNQKAAAKQAK